MLISIMLSITIILAVLFIVGLSLDNLTLRIIPGILLGFIVFYFWLLYGVTEVHSQDSIEIVPNVVKTQTAVIMEYGDTRTICEEVATYIAVDDSSVNYELVTEYNLYGGVLSKSINLKSSK